MEPIHFAFTRFAEKPIQVEFKGQSPKFMEIILLFFSSARVLWTRQNTPLSNLSLRKVKSIGKYRPLSKTKGLSRIAVKSLIFGNLFVSNAVNSSAFNERSAK